ncbi:MAG: hypothetical protein AAF447_19870 [Myxococcota bacterium]
MNAPATMLAARTGTVLVLLTLAACAEAAGRAPAGSMALEGPAPRALPVTDGPPGTTRTLLLEALAGAPGASTLVGRGTWATRVLPRPGESPREAGAAGRTFVRRSLGARETPSHGATSQLELAYRLGAGDRGAYLGGRVRTGAERVMAELRVSDPGTVGARFVLRFFATGPRERLRDVTPGYLRGRPLGRGVYRSWVPIPPSGARVLAYVEVRVRGERVAEGYASPVSVERPWLD